MTRRRVLNPVSKKVVYLVVAVALVFLLGVAILPMTPTPVQAAPGTLTVVPFTLATSGAGTAVWTNTDSHTGSWSVQLTTSANGDYAGLGMTAYSGTINSITSLSFWYKDTSYANNCGPRMSLSLKKGSNNYLAVTGCAVNSTGWKKADAIYGVKNTDWYTTGTPSQIWWYGTWDGANPSSYHQSGGPMSFSSMKALPLLTGASVLGVSVYMGVVGSSVGAGSAYIDDIKVNTTTYYGMIQDAIGVALSGDTINVAAGTYTENVNVNKSLTLHGASSAIVTVTAANPAVSVFYVTASSVNISGFTVSGATGGGQAGIFLGAGVALCNISNNILTGSFDGIWLGAGSNHNTFTGNTLSSNYQGFEVYISSNNTFTNNIANSNSNYGFKIDSGNLNTFTHNTANSNGKYGFYVVIGDGGGATNSTFTHNTANSNTEYGIRINGGSGNTLTGNTFDSNGLAGLRLKEVLINLTVDHNNITNSLIGIDIAAPVTDVTSWAVNYNNIAGNTNYGISNLGTGTLNATDNWWGDPTGPYNGATNPSATGDAVTSGVDYTPWLDASYPGGAERDHNVDNLSDGEYNSIQDAIDAADPGDTLEVLPGKYHESLEVDVPDLTICSSAGAEKTIIEFISSIDPDGAGFNVTANYVTIQGFTITGFYVGIDVYAGNCTISQNIITNNVWGIGIWGDDNTIDHNTIKNNVCGIWIAGDENTISNSTIKDNEYWGIEIYGNDNIISDNTIEDNREGIYIFYGGYNAIEYNDICNNQDWFCGIYLEDYAGDGNYAHDNNIVGNWPYGVCNDSLYMFDAEDNWWGDPTGPHAIDNPSATGDAVSANVTYSPWLDAPSPDGAERDHNVDNLSDGEYNSIQEAIDAADAGDTLAVLPGKYDEAPYVNVEGLTINSTAGAEQTTIDDTISTGITITADNVTIGGTPGHGFNITLFVFGIYIDGNSTTISYNIIENNYDDGIFINGTADNVIEYNTIRNNEGLVCGIHVAAGAEGNHVNYNNIEGNWFYGVYNDPANPVLDAERNWWGDASGPHHPVTNPVATGDEVSNNVDYIPWLGGPWPDGELRYGNVENTRTHETFGTIRGAINDSDTRNGDTLLVFPGKYQESVTVNKRLTICSSNGAEMTIIDGTSGGFTITVPNVIIGGTPGHGFTITMFATGIYLTESGDNCAIRYNIIENNGDGIYINGGDNNRIEYNTIRGNGMVTSGIHVARLSSGNVVRYNRIEHNAGYGVYNDPSNAPLDATFNWWGDVHGPRYPNTWWYYQGDMASGKVNSSPWLIGAYEDSTNGTRLYIGSDKTFRFMADDGYDSGLITNRTMTVRSDGWVSINFHSRDMIWHPIDLVCQCNGVTGYCNGTLYDRTTAKTYPIHVEAD